MTEWECFFTNNKGWEKLISLNVLIGTELEKSPNSEVEPSRINIFKLFTLKLGKIFVIPAVTVSSLDTGDLVGAEYTRKHYQ